MSRSVKARVVVVDDEQNIRRLLTGVLEDEGYECRAVGDLDALRATLGDEGADLVLLDVCLPGSSGLDWLAERRRESGPVTVMMSGHATIDLALRAVRLGAADFLEKPIAVERLLVCLENALSLDRLRRENQRLRRERVGGVLLGESEPMRRLRESIERAGPTDATVLVTGENGTGKELVAHALFEASPRCDAPFVRVNCAAIPADLLESELFGHERGAFTGAVRMRRGRFEVADGGTLLLDEIGDLPLPLQAKLLRALEEGEITRVGAEHPRRVDVRVIASTNRSLPDRVAGGAFREDLYYRLAVLPLTVPPLRDRGEDVLLLARTFLERFAAEHGRPTPGLDEAAAHRLRRHAWPGNVRELRNLMERLVILGPGGAATSDPGATGRVTSDDVDRLLLPLDGPQIRPGRTTSVPAEFGTLASALEDFERDLIARCLEAEAGNVAAAARRLGLDRANLHRKMRRLGVGRA